MMFRLILFYRLNHQRNPLNYYLGANLSNMVLFQTVLLKSKLSKSIDLNCYQ